MTPLESLNMVSEALQGELSFLVQPYREPLSFFKLEMPQGSSHLYFLPNMPGSLLRPSVLAFAQATPWPGALFTQCGECLFAVSLSSFTSFPLSPSVAQIGLKWNETLCWEKAVWTCLLNEKMDDFLPLKTSWESLE